MKDFFSFKPVLTDDYFHGKPLAIDHTPQLLFGDVMVEDVWRVKSETEVPKYCDDFPIIERTRPYETYFERPSVIYDEDYEIYRMWYAGDGERNVLYTESDDGIHFVKPDINLIDTDKYPDNNFVFFEGEVNKDGARIYPHHCLGRVIRNPDKSDLERRFIMIYVRESLSIAYSADGIRWTTDICSPAGIYVDCTVNLMYDESRGMWQAFGRPAMYAKDERIDWHHQRDIFPNGVYRRDVNMLESPDLVHWSASRIVYRPDETFFRQEADNIKCFSIGNYSLGFCAHFSELNEHTSYAYDGSQHMFPYMVCGNDTAHMRMTPDKKCLLETKRDGSPALHLLISHPYSMVDDENSIYFLAGGSERYNMTRCPDGHNLRALYRVKYEGTRFVSRTGDYYGGWLLTRQFILDGSEIEIDAAAAKDTKYGEIRCEIVGEDGAPIDGFTFADSDPIIGDSFHHKLTWNGSDDITALRGKAVYLRFLLVASKIYSFTVNE